MYGSVMESVLHVRATGASARNAKAEKEMFV
jgi:hypothetical protein